MARPVNAKVFDTGSYPVGYSYDNKVNQLDIKLVIGEDEAGKFILNHCRECGMVIRNESVRNEQITGMNVVLVDENGSRSFDESVWDTQES